MKFIEGGFRRALEKMKHGSKDFNDYCFAVMEPNVEQFLMFACSVFTNTDAPSYGSTYHWLSGEDVSIFETLGVMEDCVLIPCHIPTILFLAESIKH